MSGLPRTLIPPCSTDTWSDPDGTVVWSGFYGGLDVAGPRYYGTGGTSIAPTSIGARVLGQEGEDHFGTAVSSDGNWLYISAPDHTATMTDVPDLTADRTASGVVYMMRTNWRASQTTPNVCQLWIEPGSVQVYDEDGEPVEDEEGNPVLTQLVYPRLDAEQDEFQRERLDYTMPTPHTYVIETVGSTRGSYSIATDPPDFVYDGLEDCLEDRLDSIVAGFGKSWAQTNPIAFEVATASQAADVYSYEPGTAGYIVDRTPQVVGPRDNSEISFVRALDDVDDDGTPDFAVGSDQITDPDPNSPYFGQNVGAIYICAGRQLGPERDYLLDLVELGPGEQGRERGLMLKGSSDGEKLGRVFDDAGDFNKDGIPDVIVGNEAALSDQGEVIVILGAPNLESPKYGYTVDGIVADGHAIRFRGAAAGDLTGTNVAGAGDVDGDGYDDILIAAPGAEIDNDPNSPGFGLPKGAVYLVYGSADLSGDVDLADIGTLSLPGVKFTGRNGGDQLGGGAKPISDTHPDGGGPITAYSRGVAALGDINDDQLADFAISAMLADPNQRQDAGEVYILYGSSD